MAVHDIIIKPRIRKDLGDVGALMESLRKFGLLNPVVINSKGELIAGHRRLESARRLGWQYIEVVVLEKEGEIEKLELEIEENIQRKSLTPDELADAYDRLEKLRNPGFVKRILDWLRQFLGNLFSKLFGRNKDG
jgi:ParB family transcriptional regulator, chromosome partitioning protein